MSAVAPRSVAARLGIQVGDVLLRVNRHPVEDVVDVQYYAAEYAVELDVRRGNEEIALHGKRDEGQPLGLEFEHPTFDIDIRRCNNLCKFCFVLQMPARMRRTLYVKDDDYRYSFLFGHFVTLTNLSKHDWWRIAHQHLSPLYVSVHATDPKVRRKCLHNEQAPDIMTQLQWLAHNRIDVHTQIVVTPLLNDGEQLENSVSDLATWYPTVKSISVVPVGLTKYHKYGLRPNTREECRRILDLCHMWQEVYRGRFGVNLVYPTDEWYLVTERPIPPEEAIDGLDLWANGLGMVRRFMDDWSQVHAELVGAPKIKRLTLATATLFAPTLGRYAAEFAEASGVATRVVPITNTRLGETITVAGLLMGDDVIEQLRDHDLGDVLVLPRIMFDHPDGISLDDRSPLDIAGALNKPVALADTMGDLIDLIYGHPALYFDPTSNAQVSAGTIQQDGGWAVEKYL